MTSVPSRSAMIPGDDDILSAPSARERVAAEFSLANWSPAVPTHTLVRVGMRPC